MFYDLALVYDPEKRACDLALGDDCDLLIDDTPITPILLSVGLDRRAAPDDELPEGRSRFLAPASFSERRGSQGDGLDPKGDLTGARIWLLDRAKETETTRLLFRFWLVECLAWAKRDTGEAPEIEVVWGAPGILTWRVMIADTSLSLSRRVEG